MFQKPGEWLMLRRPRNPVSRAVNDHSSDIKDNWDSDKIMRERKLFLGLMTRARSNAAQSIPWWRWQEAISRTSAFAPNQPDQIRPDQARLACLCLLSPFSFYRTLWIINVKEVSFSINLPFHCPGQLLAAMPFENNFMIKIIRGQAPCHFFW